MKLWFHRSKKVFALGFQSADLETRRSYILCLGTFWFGFSVAYKR